MMIRITLLVSCLTIGFFASAQFWREEASNFPLSGTGLYRFSTPNDSTAWAIGYDGVNGTNIQRFSRTINYGQSWNADTFALGDPDLGISMISAVDTVTAWVAAFPRQNSGFGGIWKTEDGGHTWNVQNGATFNTTLSFPNVVHFFDNDVGLAIGDPVNGEWEIYRTTNGGTTYTQVLGTDLPDPLAGEFGYIANYAARGNSLWFTTSEGRLFHTTDRGLSWDVLQSPLNDFGGANEFGRISFSTTQRGVILSGDGTLFFTADGGSFWTERVVTSAQQPFKGDIAYIADLPYLVTVGATPNDSGSAYSLDYGTTWTLIDTEQHIDVAFYDEYNGYSGSFSRTSAEDGVWVYQGTALSNETHTMAEERVQIFPNPVESSLQLSAQTSISNWAITNLMGQVVMRRSETGLVSTTSIDLSALDSGIYFVTIHTVVDTYRHKIIKK